MIYCSCCRGSTDGWKFLLVGGAAAVYTPQGMGLEDLWKISRVDPELSMEDLSRRCRWKISRVDAANLVYCSCCRGSTGGASSLRLNLWSPTTVDRWYLATRVSRWMERFFFVGSFGKYLSTVCTRNGSRGRKVQARDDFVPVGSSTECTGSRQKKGSALNNLYKRRLIKSVDS